MTMLKFPLLAGGIITGVFGPPTIPTFCKAVVVVRFIPLNVQGIVNPGTQAGSRIER